MVDERHHAGPDAASERKSIGVEVTAGANDMREAEVIDPDVPRQKTEFAGRPNPVVDQTCADAQTVQFIADRQTEIASSIDQLLKDRPELEELSAVAAVEREHRKSLMEMAQEEQRLATAVQFHEDTPDMLAATHREHRKEFLEMARREGRLAETLLATDDQDATVQVLAEQAVRNQGLLRMVAENQTRADHALRESEKPDSHGTTPKK